MSVETLYNAVRSGKIKLDQLNQEGIHALNDYMKSPAKNSAAKFSPLQSGIYNNDAKINASTESLLHPQFSNIQLPQSKPTLLQKAGKVAGEVLDYAQKPFQAVSTTIADTEGAVKNLLGSHKEIGYDGSPVTITPSQPRNLFTDLKSLFTHSNSDIPSQAWTSANPNPYQFQGTNKNSNDLFNFASQLIGPGEILKGAKILKGVSTAAKAAEDAGKVIPLTLPETTLVKEAQNPELLKLDKGMQDFENHMANQVKAGNITQKEAESAIKGKQILNEHERELLGDQPLNSSAKNVTQKLEDAAKNLENIDYLGINDLRGKTGQFRDVYRNLEQTLGEHAQPYIKSLNDSKAANIGMQDRLLKELKSEIVDKLGIKKGSKLSALVQKFGEKKISLEELKKTVPHDWENVVKADKWFRNKYDTLLDQVNDTRAKLYPTNPEKIVPKRSDYYRHFQDINGLTGLKNLFETPAQISPKLEGISEFTKPRSKFAGFMQRRGMGPYKNDAVGGFLNYVPSAAQSIHIDPQISIFRKLAKDIGEVTEDTKNANKLVQFLNKYANSLAGKSHDLDRALMDNVIPGGRKTMGFINWLNSRVKKNTILANASSLLAQMGNIPNGIAVAKQYSLKGFGDTLLNAIGKETTPIKKSLFLKERYHNTREFDTKWFEQPLKAASWFLETADKVGTDFIWNSMYTKGLAEKVADPIAYADDLTRKMVGGRGVGEVPLIQQSKLFQVVAPFTLEVMNGWRVIGDLVKKKDITGLMTLFVASYMFNQASKKIRGSGVVFDPIQAIKEAMQPGLTPIQRGGRLAGEVLSNLPLGSTIASWYPEYGKGNLGTRKEIFGNNDPTRFGNGLVVMNGILDPLYKLLPPFGGNQLKKTIQGIQSIKDGGVVKGGKLRAPIDYNPLKAAQSLLFSPNATSEMQQYYDQERRPLSINQTEFYNSLPKDQKLLYYDNLMNQRKLNTLKTKYQDVLKSDMTAQRKQKEIDKLINQYNKLRLFG